MQMHLNVKQCSANSVGSMITSICVSLDPLGYYIILSVNDTSRQTMETGAMLFKGPLVVSKRWM